MEKGVFTSKIAEPAHQVGVEILAFVTDTKPITQLN